MNTSRQEQINECRAEIEKLIERENNKHNDNCNCSEFNYWGGILDRLLAEEDFGVG